MIIQKEENHGDYLAMRQHPQQPRIFMVKAHAVYLVGSAGHDKIIILHDNARPHIAVPVKNYVKTLDWEVPSHPPYSPGIVSFDYHLFRTIAHALSEQRFTSCEDTKNWVDSWIASKDTEFFRLIIRTLAERRKKVVASDGQYCD
ncbi:Mariner Mos1 transposase [Eumeta japonica]|uniref:Mariner Mos1 transposase n=1 Tax=Eumeta variegata TaxID=151549 RepID=A0A4C1XLQ4_EUMVA|nr:Mariner Mos1 transposase [Eumeta japonica]